MLAPFLCFTSAQAQVIGQDITSIATDTVSFPTISINNVAGDSEFAGSTFTLNFGGQIQSITELTTAGGSTTLRSIPAFVEIRRNPATDGRKLAYYQGSFDSSSNTFNFLSLGPLPERTLFSINNILAGPDNVFTNTGANLAGTPYNGNASIERLDFVLLRPVKANKKIGFTVFERGLPTGHDGFGIAAITSVDRRGNPTSYGPIYVIAASTWGKTPLQDPIPQYYFLNNAANNNRGIPINPALTIPPNQVLGGILIRTDELVSPGQKVYGYSLFAPDVTCTPTTLLNVANSCFPTNTGTNGGIDLAAPNLGAVFLESE
ncbi:MAG: hypothetical protein RM347_031875 [Nostoc sp. ChiQUE02]|uniref:hypothetical protein n=1 Tax=Nostoc sp. ChiQUE02 TaxID=3075377 RepID=UPI002AD29F18|nr:hypothetical protein [Nostoc sp. ChiQUE02]MDZ8233763.1 hypothetical protein [Nostoc sp. ChiQUE02]